jgi:RimJ/RimL family protein N-acetyltransferase
MLVKRTDSFAYELGDLIVAPYPTQDVLGASYLRFKQEEILEMFFHEDEKPREMLSFLTWAMEKDGFPLGAYLRRPNTDVIETIGLGKVSIPRTMGWGYSKAEVCMLFFREYQVRSLTLPACQMFLEQIFDRLTVDVLFGTIPEHNRASVRFMKSIGFEHQDGPVKNFTTWKGKICGAMISQLTRERWGEISPFKS